jgi:hypothetical protein
MKKFIKKIFLFLFIPVIITATIEELLPVTFFTHRPWEALEFHTSIPHNSKFYPNTTASMDAQGDLCYNTDKAVLRRESWITDKLGYRNDSFIQQPDILFIGDSFIAGCSLNQNETITNRVRYKLNDKTKVYNMAPCTFSEFDKYIKEGLIKKPRIIIFSIVERDLPDPLILYTENKRNKLTDIIKQSFETGNVNVFLDRAFRFFSIEWVKSKINGSKGLGIPAKGNHNMYFLNGPNDLKKYSDSDAHTSAKTIITYKKYCDSLGIDFIFMPMPDKETVYPEQVPFNKQPNYLFELDSLLNQANIATINTLKIYNHYRESNSQLLYHLDDTHWNSNATDLISNEIINKIKGINSRDQKSVIK